MTWEDLAEEQEMVAKALTMRAKGSRWGAAFLTDAAEMIGEARRFRDMHEDGGILTPYLGVMLSVAP